MTITKTTTTLGAAFLSLGLLSGCGAPSASNSKINDAINNGINAYMNTHDLEMSDLDQGLVIPWNLANAREFGFASYQGPNTNRSNDNQDCGNFGIQVIRPGTNSLIRGRLLGQNTDSTFDNIVVCHDYS